MKKNTAFAIILLFCTLTLKSQCTSPIPIKAMGDTICQTTMAIIYASGAQTYTWVPGNIQGVSIISNANVTTTYTVTGTDINGCTSSATALVLVNPAPQVDFLIDASLEPTISFTDLTVNGLTYVWNFGDNTTSNSKNITHLYQDTGKYMVCLKVENNGCYGQACKIVPISMLSSFKNDNETNPSHIYAYPNPSSETITISRIPQGTTLLRITTMSGQTVLIKQARFADCAKEHFPIEIGDIAKGIYLIESIGKQGVLDRTKFIVN